MSVQSPRVRHPVCSGQVGVHSMAQLFRPEATTAFRLILIAAVLLVLAVLAGAYLYLRSDWFWRIGESAPQPIPFRHDLHVAGIGVACAFCHSTAKRSAHAGMPTAQTCLTCHSQILQGATVLEPLRTSVGLNQPIRWASVHRLPSFVYFHHGVHLSRGVTCETCHGRVDQMRDTEKVHSLSMGWCLECHRNPGKHIGPDAEPLSRASAPSDVPASKDSLRVSEVFADPLTDCSVCHR